MKISLRKARKLETSISDHKFKVDGNSVSAREVSFYDDVDEKTDFVDKKLTGFQGKTLSFMNKSIKLVEIKFFIRNEISKKNSESGINNLMAQKNSLLSVLHIVENLISKASDLNANDIVYLAKKDKESNTQSPYGLSNDSTTMKTWAFPPISSNSKDLEALESKVFKLKSEIEDVDDKLMGLNSTVTIELENDDVDFLKELKVIR